VVGADGQVSQASMRAEKVAKFIAENPNSIAAIKVTDPELYAAKMADAQAYTDNKVAAFKALSPEERRNYRGGF